MVLLMYQSVKKKNANASNKMLSGREGGGGEHLGIWNIQYKHLLKEG